MIFYLFWTRNGSTLITFSVNYQFHILFSLEYAKSFFKITSNRSMDFNFIVSFKSNSVALGTKITDFI